VAVVPWLLALAGCVQPEPAADPSEVPLRWAAAFLRGEVDAWQPENGCWSCHNQGDAARALYVRASRLRPLRDPVPETTRWLQQPAEWQKNGGEGPTSDRKLARLQFAAALVAARDAGVEVEARVLLEAADLLARDQAASGAWGEDTAGLLGSPITWGPVLATRSARHTLRAVSPSRFAVQIARAERWLGQVTPATVLDAAAMLLALPLADIEATRRQKRAALAVLERGQGSDGGWGPGEKSPPEVFDTALAVIALSRHAGEPGVRTRIARGRGFLLATQQADGGWPETTRPAGGTSYAHRISTSGWALEALAATAEIGDR
jgi:hypothetical protein